MKTKDLHERIPFDCPKLQGRANLTFITRQHFVDEFSQPALSSLYRHDCDGRLRCGITPRFSNSSWGPSDWKLCEYPNLSSKGVR